MPRGAGHGQSPLRGSQTETGRAAVVSPGLAPGATAQSPLRGWKRSRMDAIGIILEDTPEGTKWRFK